MPESTSETPEGRPRSGSTLDLSTGKAGRAPRPKGFVPVVQQTINLTTKREAPPEPVAPKAEAPPAARPQPHASGTRRDDRRRDDPRGGRPSGGTSLADLLDAETLARLRGGR